MNHHILSVHETQQLLNTSKNGLHQSDAEERLLENGRNELVEKKKKRKPEFNPIRAFSSSPL